MDTKNLKKQHHVWSVRLKVPQHLRGIVGKAELWRSLKTSDLREADRLKHGVLAAMKAELKALERGRAGIEPQTPPPTSASFVLAEAVAQRDAVRAGRTSLQSAAVSMDAAEDFYRDALARQYGIDPETGDPNAPQSAEQAETLRLAQRVAAGEDVLLLSEAITKYLAEVQSRITRAGYAQKDNRLTAFREWLKVDVDVRSITKKKAGQYVAEKIQTMQHATKTKQDTIASLSAFWSWLELYDHADSNVWRNMTKLLKDSTRGGTRPTKRPYTLDELSRLIALLEPGTPLLPLVCLGAYSGCRIEELCAMKATDVTPEAFRVMQGKNTNSVRYVPIHPVIAPMVKTLCKTSQDGYLITGLLTGGADDKRSHYASKRFGSVMDKHGFAEGELDFHSLRRSFQQRLETAQVPLSTTDLLVGHARQSLSYGLYSPGPDFPVLVEAVGKVSYGDTITRQVTDLAGAVRITKKSARRHKRKAA